MRRTTTPIDNRSSTLAAPPTATTITDKDDDIVDDGDTTAINDDDDDDDDDDDVAEESEVVIVKRRRRPSMKATRRLDNDLRLATAASLWSLEVDQNKAMAARAAATTAIANQQYGLRVREVVGDGKCAFRAVAVGLGSSGSLNILDDDERTAFVRKRAIDVVGSLLLPRS